MRFKRLRKAVGISIVLFILIVGSIILIGSINQNSVNNIAPTTNKNQISSAQTPTTNTQANTQTPTQQQYYQPPVVYHPYMVSGAS